MTEQAEHTENKEELSPPDGFEDARRQILPVMLSTAPFDGWTEVSLREAATEAGVDSAAAHAAFPGGPADVLRYWSDEADRAMTQAMSGPSFDAMKIREKVAFGVLARIGEVRPNKEAARRAAAFLALPLNAPLGASLAWSTADAIWRGLGDKSADFNFYSKRAILTGVWTSVFARWLGDDSEDEKATCDFLDARIANVMEIEKAKARMKKAGFDFAAPASFLAKLRYPAPR